MSLYASIIAEDGDKKAKSLPGDVDKESKPATFIPRAIVAPRSLIPGRKIPGNAPGSLPIPDFSTKSRSVSNSNPLLNASPRMSSFSPSNTSPTLAPAQNSLSNRDTKTPSSVSGYDLVNDSTSLHIEQPRERYDPRKPNDVDVILAQRERVAREKERAKERELELERMRERAAADREQQERAWEMRERERTQQAHRDASRATAAADQATSSITDASGGAAAVSPAPAQPKVPYINSARMAALGLQRLAQPAPSPSLVASGAAATVGSNSTTGGVSQSVADQVDAEALVAPLSAPLSLLQSAIATPTIIILNACARFRADAVLKEEIASECARSYGPVRNCQMCDLSLQGGADNQCVRIFVKFDSLSSAIRAQKALKGRWFDGRELDCLFCKENLNI